MDEIYENLKSAERLYVVYNKLTGYPYIDDNENIWVFTQSDYAQAAVSYFEPMGILLFFTEVVNQGFEKEFQKIGTLGVESARVDNGKIDLVIELDKIAAKPDYSHLSPEQIPVTNPNLQKKLIRFFQLLRMNTNSPEKNEVLHKFEAEMLAEVLPAKFLVPMQNQQFANLNDNRDQSNWLPAFTDWNEFGKMYDKKQWTGMILTYDNLLEVAGIRGIVINAGGINFRITAGNRMAIEQFRHQMPEQPQPVPMPAPVQKPAPQPEPAPVSPQPAINTAPVIAVPMTAYPSQIVESLKRAMNSMPEVRRAYLVQTMQGRESGYLVVVDFLGDQDQIFGQLSQVTAPFLGQIHVTFHEADLFGLEMAKNTKPFYKKGLFS